MLVTCNPGTFQENTVDLSDVMRPEGANEDQYTMASIINAVESVAKAHGNLVDMLVEKGVLTLADCRRLGGPDMQPYGDKLEDLPCA